ncbi:MAG: redoxin family protein [Bacteroidota bacterium]
MIRLIIIFSITLAFSSASAQLIESFSGLDVEREKEFSLSEHKNNKAIVVIFFSNKCAYSDYYIARVKSLVNDFNTQKVKFVLINSNNDEFVKEESAQGMKDYAANNLPGITYVADKDKKIKSLLNATRTPEAFVLKPILDRYEIVYQGAIDDSPQSERDVSHEYLKEAIVSLLSVNKIELNKTRPVGCLIK